MNKKPARGNVALQVERTGLSSFPEEVHQFDQEMMIQYRPNQGIFLKNQGPYKVKPADLRANLQSLGLSKMSQNV